MKLLSKRSEALAAGASHYFTGLACFQGHVDRRLTSNGMCMTCTREKAAAKRRVNRKSVPKAPRQLAKEAGQIRYSTGKPCKKGHIAERFTSNGMCCVCEYEKQRMFLQQSADVHRANAKKWAKANPDKVRAMKRPCNANRRAAQMNRTPSWLTDADYMRIKVKHAEARWMTAHTGIPHAVDHIFPLQGKTVSGLHVPSNMRVIPMRENSRKSNKIIAG